MDVQLGLIVECHKSGEGHALGPGSFLLSIPVTHMLEIERNLDEGGGRRICLFYPSYILSEIEVSQ